MSRSVIFDRREMLKLLVLAGAAAPLLGQEKKAGTSAEEYIARLESFFGETDDRPEFIWVNREDVFYHDEKCPPGLIDAPEYNSLQHKAWVFNRSMNWLREDSTILCYEAAGDLRLTGSREVPGWFTGNPNKLPFAGDAHLFEKHSPRRRDAAVLPAFQFHLGQHPVIEVEVTEANTDWQFVVSLKGRGGKPLIASAWQKGAAKMQFDLAAGLARQGYVWTFPELHFAIGTWNWDRDHVSRLRYAVRMPALVGCLPVIRTATRARTAGVRSRLLWLTGRGASRRRARSYYGNRWRRCDSHD